MLFEPLENRSLLATITGNTAIGGFEALNSSSLLYQLSASSLALANGDPVTAWNNSGAAANNFTQADVNKQPTFVGSGSLGNGLPTVSFDGNISGFSGNPAVAPNADELLLSSSTAPATVFIVNSTASNNGLDGIIGQELGDFGIRRQSSSAWQHPGNGNDLTNPGALYVNGVTGINPAAALNAPIVLTAMRPTGTAMAPTSLGDYFQVGANQPRSWGGEIGDLLAFSRTLSLTERTIIENALSAKYGINLAAGDIYAGDNAGLGDYDRGVIGIGGQAVTNVALGKDAIQSSLGAGLGDAPHAVDGNTDGNYGARSITHTNSEANPFWQVDLGGSFSITSIDLWNRTDCCGNRLQDLRVQILDASNAVIWQNAALINPGNVLGSPAKITVDLVVLNGLPVTGNKVRVISEGAAQILSLAEVQVWATSTYANVAVGDPSIQSSTAFGGTPDRGNDGNTNGNFGGNSVTHTNTEANPFWRVDLGVDTPISQVLLFNRTDCCGERLSDVQVEVLDAALTPVFSMTGLNAANTLDNPYMFGVDVQTANGGVPVTGRYVRVTAVGASQILSLAEVQVMTPATAAGPAVGSAGSDGFGIEQSGPAGMANFLTAGYKQVANSVVNTDLPAGVDGRWDRAWYVDKTGSLSATMAFDFSDAGIASIPAGTVGYQLLYSPTNNFESANSSFTALNLTPTVVGDLVTFSVPDGTLLDGYYSLGLLNQTATLQAGSGTAGDGTADAWRIVRSGPGGVNLDFYQGATLVRSSPYASITAVNVVGSSDNDTLTVDQSGGVIARPVTYSGGGQTGIPGDSLVISGGSATTVTHTFINNSDGSVNIDGSVISYTGLEPITDNMVVANRVFTFTGAAETISLTDSGGADNMTRIDSSLGEFVDFVTPTATLTINTNGGDTTTITSFDAAFNTPLMTFADSSGTTSTFNLAAADIIPNVTGLILTGNVNFNLNNFNEQIASLASTNATPVVTLSAGRTLTVGDATNTVYSGTLVGNGTLAKTGTGIFTISGAGTATNSANGLLRVDGGTVVLGAGFTGDGAWQGNITINNTGTLQYAQNNIVNNSADFTINTGGVLNMAGFSDAIGNVQGGGNITNSGGITLDDLSGTRTFSGNINGGGLTVRGAIDATGAQVLDGATYAFTGVVVGRGTLTFNNTPTVTMSGTFAVGDTNGAGVSSGAITAVANINGGTFTINHVEVGNRQSGSATVTATINQTAGTVSSSGGAVDGANYRIGHWPGTNAFYNLSGSGILNAGTAIGTAVDGNGTFTQTGGTLNTPAIIVNLRNATGTGTFTLNGGIANVGAGGITTTGTPGTNSFLNLGGATVRATATFSSSHAAVLTNAVGPAIFNSNTFNITMSGVLSGAGALTKQGSGVLTLSGANSFGGSVLVSGGVVSVGDIADSGTNSHLGSGTGITLAGGTLRYTAAAVDSSNRPITLGAGNGGIEVSVAGGDITYSGGVTGGTNFTKFGPGNLTFSPANLAFGTLFAAGGNLTLAGTGTANVSGTILVGASTADGAQGTGSGTLNIQGSVVVNTGAVSVVNQGSTAGTINQSGTSDVNVASGFRIGHWPGAIGTYNISGGTLDVTGNPAGVANPAGVGEQNGVIYLGVDGTGVMNISATGAVTATGVVLDGRGNTAGTDTLTINGGSLTLGNNTNATTIAASGLFTGSLNANTSYQINLGGGGTLRSVTGFSTPLAMNLTGAGANAINVNTNGVNLTFTGVLSGTGGLAKVGVGNLLLTNTNTYGDVTNVNAGTLQLQNGAAIADTAGAVNVALGATLQLLNSETVSSYSGSGDIGVGTNDSTLALGANTLTTTGNAAIANVTTASGGGIIAGGSITDTDDDNNITGPNVYLQAAIGVGTSGDPIETAVSAIQVRNTTSGVINVFNRVGGLLTVSDLRALGFGARNDGGATTVINGSPLVIAAPSVSAGPVLIEARDNGSLINADFNTNDGGFTVVNGGAVEDPWTYNPVTGNWFTNGTQNVGSPTFSELNSGIATVAVAGPVTLSFRHRYSFEFDGTRWDGGQVRVSVNGGAFTAVPNGSFSAGGYAGVITGNNILNGQLAYNGDSPGYASNNFITSVANLGVFNPGDTIRVQFVGAWDEFAEGTNPNWEIDSVSVFTPNAVAGDDLTVNALVQSTGSSVTLNAGDNMLVNAPVTSATVSAMNVDSGNSDAGVGGNLTIASAITTPVVGLGGGALLSGNTDNDTFTFNPQTTTEFRLLGDAPVGTPTGDTLVMNVTSTTNPNLTVPGSLTPYNGLGSGAWSFTSAHRPVLFGSIEQSTITGNYHLTFDNSVAPIGNLFVMRDAGGTNVQLRDGSTAGPIVYQGSLATVLSLRILGSAGNDIVTVDDINTLPAFAGTVPGVTDNTNLAGTAELLFDGLGGSDTLVYNINGADALQFYAIGNGTGAAGLEGEIDSIVGPISLKSYFQNVELTQRTGVGTSPGFLDILGDQSGNSFSTAANGAFTRTSITGYTPFEFSGNNYSELYIFGTAGNDSIDLISLGTVQTNNPTITFNGGANDDTIRVRSTSGNTGLVTLNGNAGSDLFQLFDAANTVDNIAGPVVVDGTDGNIGANTDTLTIVDSGDGSADNVIIAAVNAGASQDYSVEGINIATGNDVVLRNVDVLNYTSTSANDSIDGRFVNTTPAHDLNSVSLSGWTGADQFLLFLSDQIGGSGLNNTPTGVASGLNDVNLFGDALGNPNAGDGNDIFGATPAGLVGTGVTNVGLVVPDTTRMIRPSTTTSIAIDGGQPTGLAAPLGDVVGDVNNVDVSALPNTTPVVVSTFSPGTVVAAGIQPLTWTQIEDINLVDQGKLTNVQMGDLFARTTPGADLIQLTRNPTPLNPNQVRLRITATIGNYSVSNKTIMYGGGHNDTLTQANLTIPAEFYGEAGDDYLSGAMNNDWLVGGDGNDRINGSGGDNVIWGDNAPTVPGDLTPQNSAAGGDDQLSGLGGNDVFYGSGGNDLVSAGGGNDYANGGFGNDTIGGHDGDDRLYGGAGNDVMGGGTGNDLLSGGDGNDQLTGNAGNDVVFGGTGNDLLDGGDGNDLLVSGSVANENSTWTSVASTTTYSAATYTNASDNDAALLTLLSQWGSASNRSSIGAITHDGANDDLSGGTGDDDFCWETADIVDNFPSLSPNDFNAMGMGSDERFGPT